MVTDLAGEAQFHLDDRRRPQNGMDIRRKIDRRSRNSDIDEEHRWLFSFVICVELIRLGWMSLVINYIVIHRTFDQKILYI